jgi:sugar O-acyltransferase (sialic acid O-acetyltransferase NeuD family)
MSETRDVVIVGSAGHARVVIDLVEREGRWRIRGLLDDFKPPGWTQCGHAVLGPIDRASEALGPAGEEAAALVAVGDNFARREIVARLRRAVAPLRFATAVHPSAQIGRDVTLGAGVVVMAGVTVNAGACVGDFAILNTRSSLDHDSTLDEFASLGPGAVTGGSTRIGAGTVIGPGACLIEGVRIGRDTVVGAGAVVVRDLPDECVAYGNPARVVRTRQPGDPYLGRAARKRDGS